MEKMPAPSQKSPKTISRRRFLQGSTATAIAAALASSAEALTPKEPLANDHVDLIEINHFYDEHGKHVFDQIIFYDWCNKDCRYHVRAWRLLKKPAQVPREDHARGGYVTIWHDGDYLRRVRSQSIRETWTQHDPELAEREHLPKEKRADLVKPQINRRDPSRRY